MRRTRGTTRLEWVVLLVGGLAGCTHNHYYYSASDGLVLDDAAPVRVGKATRPPQTVIVEDPPTRVVSRSPSTTRIIDPSLCDDDTIVLSQPPARASSRSSTSSGGSRVVISRPTRGAVARNSRSSDWYPITRSSKVDRLVSTEIDDETLQR